MFDGGGLFHPDGTRPVAAWGAGSELPAYCRGVPPGLRMGGLQIMLFLDPSFSRVQVELGHALVFEAVLRARGSNVNARADEAKLRGQQTLPSSTC